jgi:GNAT superfamily N-acetyltransferase
MSPLEVVEADTDAAFSDVVAIRNRAMPEDPWTVEEVRFMSELEPGAVHLLALEDFVPVGSAFCGPMPMQLDSGDGEAGIRVPPERRGQGVGSALFEACAARLRDLGKTAVRINVREDNDEARRFLGGLGFTEIGRNQFVALDLSTLPDGAPAAPDGFTIVSLAERPDFAHGAWQVDHETTGDIPGPDGKNQMGWEVFQKLLTKPGLDHRLVLVAVVGDEVVGLALLSRNAADPSLASHWMTGVRRPWRRRGIAAALKEHQLATARALGVRKVRTLNELRNEPIRRLNERLGYEREPDVIVLRGPVDETVPPGDW